LKTYTPAPEVVARINNDFVFHPPVEGSDQVQRYEHIRELCRQLAMELAKLCPPSRELSVALTSLDQAMFWGNAAIARNEKG
jgi:hypothetical protein